MVKWEIGEGEGKEEDGQQVRGRWASDGERGKRQVKDEGKVKWMTNKEQMEEA